MATPKTITDGTTPFDEANLNKFLSSDGSKVQVKVYHAHIRYNGASWIVDSAEDAAGLVSGDLAWSTDHLVITLSGFTNVPIAMVCAVSTATTPPNTPMVDAISNTQINVYFFDGQNPPVADTTQGTDMDFNIIIIGF